MCVKKSRQNGFEIRYGSGYLQEVIVRLRFPYTEAASVLQGVFLLADAPSKAKPLRADAERNRQRLLDAAKTAFARDGSATSLEDIARSAGVGIGTLYRHFPTRDALIGDVYRQALDQLASAADRLIATETPFNALHKWLHVFVDYIATKRLMADAMASLTGGPGELYASTGQKMKDAVEKLAARAVSSGDINPDVAPMDLLRAIAGVAYQVPDPTAEPGTRAMVDLLMAGLRKR